MGGGSHQKILRLEGRTNRPLRRFLVSILSQGSASNQSNRMWKAREALSRQVEDRVAGRPNGLQRPVEGTARGESCSGDEHFMRLQGGLGTLYDLLRGWRDSNENKTTSVIGGQSTKPRRERERIGIAQKATHGLGEQINTERTRAEWHRIWE